jgi:hypothetical protein
MQQRGQLTVDAHLAEIEEYPPAIGGTPKTQLWTEAGEQKYLINLTRYRLVAGAGQNFVKDNFALGIKSRLQKQSAGIRRAVYAGDSWKREWRDTDQTRRLNQIQRQIIRDNTGQRKTYQNILDEKHKDYQCRENAAGRGQRHRLENFLEPSRKPRPESCQLSTARTRLRCLHAYLQRKVAWDRDRFDVRQASSELTVALKLFAASRARIQMLSYGDMLPRANRAIQVTG